MSAAARLPGWYLQVPGLPVYGVAIPTVSGLRLVLDQMNAMQGTSDFLLSRAACVGPSPWIAKLSFVRVQANVMLRQLTGARLCQACTCMCRTCGTLLMFISTYSPGSYTERPLVNPTVDQIGLPDCRDGHIHHCAQMLAVSGMQGSAKCCGTTCGRSLCCTSMATLMWSGRPTSLLPT
jgi:hypothetical protein